MKSEKIKYIEDDVEYVLTRPTQYIGSIEHNKDERYVYNYDTNTFEFKEIDFVPAFLKLFDEILTNSVDESIKTNYKYGNKIGVDFKSDGTIIISDNGRGISSELEENTKLPEAVVATTFLKAGSNFDDTIDSESLGQNGVGSTCVNIFSKKFVCDTSDGIKRTLITCSDNLSKKSFTQRKNKSQYTIITFLPDYERFNIDIKASYKLYNALIFQRLISMSLCHEPIDFTYNSKPLKKLNLKQYVKMYDETNTNLFKHNNDFFDIAIIPFQEKYEVISFVSGADTYKNGQHVVSFESRLYKSFENYKAGKRSLNGVEAKHLLSNCKVFITLKHFKKPRFSSQIKNELINSISDFKDYWKDFDFDVLIKSIITNKNHMGLVKDYSSFNEKMKERKDVGKIEKTLKKRKIAKYLAPISNRLEYCHLYICEGDSAIGQLINVRDNFTAGYPLRGKIMNPRKQTPRKVVENEIIQDLLTILKLKVSSDDVSEMPFKSIRILTDADSDGTSIAMLLINLFYTYWPDLFKYGVIKLVKSPLIEAKKNGSKEIVKFYSEDEYKLVENNYNVIKFNKGLGSLSKATYKEMIMNPKLITFKADENTENILEMLFGKSNQDMRKEWISGV